MTDQANSLFAMPGAREAMSRGLYHISPQVEAIERAVQNQPALAFDLARTLVESTLRAILSERGVSYGVDDDVPGLFRTLSNNLPLLPPEASQASDSRASIRKTLGGLTAAVQGICELRNQLGFASHGSDSARPAMDPIQALLAAKAADAVIGFLYQIHKQDRSERTQKPLYHDNPDFNKYVDDIHSDINVFEATFDASRVLYEMEPETYRSHLAEFGIETINEDVI